MALRGIAIGDASGVKAARGRIRLFRRMLPTVDPGIVSPYERVRIAMLRLPIIASLLTALVACSPAAPPEVVQAPAPSPSSHPAESADENISVHVATRAIAVGKCRLDVRYPEVSGPLPLVRATKAWVERWFTDFTERRKEDASEPGYVCPVELPKVGAAEDVAILHVRGLIQLSWMPPGAADQKFFPAHGAIFAVDTGERFDTLVRADAAAELLRTLAPRYRAAYRTVRKECDTSRWGPDLGAFWLSAGGVSFSDWDSIPMADKVCVGDRDENVSLVVSFDELEPYLRDDVARCVRSKHP